MATRLAGGKGLTAVRSEDLTSLLRWLHRGDLQAPIDLPALARVGLQHCGTELMGHLRGLDQRGIQAVIVAVLAERSTPRPPAQPN